MPLAVIWQLYHNCQDYLVRKIVDIDNIFVVQYRIMDVFLDREENVGLIKPKRVGIEKRRFESIASTLYSQREKMLQSKSLVLYRFSPVVFSIKYTPTRKWLFLKVSG
ncbi:hypothetical protein MBAV_005217 [Candidatus Magnetobacterium bavaricum]|uniref:Uncharacterized protein n=1 Tax=Candidatus Magnetobacterium bavaricum TaxID=29290 RepID=A0A0F3GKT9_9BACT|nr:hypothetical protein MBAV_005217 [Candidatus Magnetobacterium bavaricum]